MAQTDQQDFSAFEGTRPVADQQKFDIGALEAWIVPNTKWPVSAAWMAVMNVS